MKMKWLSFCIALGLHYRWIRLLRRPQSRLGKLAEVCHLRSLLIRVAALGNINSSKPGWLRLPFSRLGNVETRFTLHSLFARLLISLVCTIFAEVIS